jgi:glycosyltransferase involved in cell wall biosynthesis
MSASASPTGGIRVLLTAGVIDGGRSGVGRYVIELAAALQRCHAGEIDLYIAGLDADREQFPEIDDAHWVSIPPRCGGGLMSFLWHQMRLAAHARRLKIDILHSPTYRRIIWRSPVEQVATIHDCAPFVLREKYGFLRGLLGRKIAPPMARRCRKVIAVSHQTAADLERYMALPREKIETVWNGIDHDHYQLADAETVKHFLAQRGQRNPYFLYVARLEHPGKNHVGLIDAFEKYRNAHPDSRAQLVFGGSDWMGAEAIHQRIAVSPLRSDIRVLGFVPDEDLPLWYAGCLAVVMPTFFEGFGIPVIEAYACGAAVGLADIGALREVGGELAEFFDPHNADEMAQCLAGLVNRLEPQDKVPAETALVGASVSAHADQKTGSIEMSGDSTKVAAEPVNTSQRARVAWAGKFSWERCARRIAKIYAETYN